MQDAGERVSQCVVIDRCQMKIERNLFQFRWFVSKTVKDAFMYLAEVLCP